MAIDERATIIEYIENYRKHIELDRKYLSMLEAQTTKFAPADLPDVLLLRIGDARFDILERLDAVAEMKETYLQSFREELRQVKAAIADGRTDDLQPRRDFLEREIDYIEAL